MTKSSDLDIIKYYENLTVKEYLNDRVLVKIRLYHKKANTNLYSYRILAVLTIIATALIPVLINTHENSKLTITIVSFLVIVGVSVESVFNFRESFKNYKNTEDSLRKEYFIFQSECTPYTKSNEENYKLLVFRIELIIATERSDTIEKLTKNLIENKKG